MYGDCYEGYCSCNPCSETKADIERDYENELDLWRERLGANLTAAGLAAERDTMLTRIMRALELVGTDIGYVAETEEAIEEFRRLQKVEQDSIETRMPQPIKTWHEEDGAVLWWRFPIVEPPYCGTPIDDDFPEYVTHWTTLEVPYYPYDDEGREDKAGEP